MVCEGYLQGGAITKNSLYSESRLSWCRRWDLNPHEEPSLRPERSASANSATSAYFLRTEFYLKDWFCQPELACPLKNPRTIFMSIADRSLEKTRSPPYPSRARLRRVWFSFKA